MKRQISSDRQVFMGSNSLSYSPVARRVIKAVKYVVVIGVVVGVGVVIFAARTALIAEENFQAYYRAHLATLEYIEQNEGKWPKSWDDLRAVRPDIDFEWVVEHVTFDFNADPGQIAKQTPDTFSAIVPDKPFYVVDDFKQELIDHIAKHHKKKTSTTEQSDELLPK